MQFDFFYTFAIMCTYNVRIEGWVMLVKNSHTYLIHSFLVKWQRMKCPPFASFKETAYFAKNFVLHFFFHKVKVHQMLIIVVTNICIRRKLPRHLKWRIRFRFNRNKCDFRFRAESRWINIDSRNELEIFHRNRMHDWS